MIMDLVKIYIVIGVCIIILLAPIVAWVFYLAHKEGERTKQLIEEFKRLTQ